MCAKISQHSHNKQSRFECWQITYILWNWLLLADMIRKKKLCLCFRIFNSRKIQLIFNTLFILFYFWGTEWRVLTLLIYNQTLAITDCLSRRFSMLTYYDLLTNIFFWLVTWVYPCNFMVYKKVKTHFWSVVKFVIQFGCPTWNSNLKWTLAVMNINLLDSYYASN